MFLIDKLQSYNKNYDLGEIGRTKLNKKFYKRSQYTISRKLLPEDILGSLITLIKLNDGCE